MDVSVSYRNDDDEFVRATIEMKPDEVVDFIAFLEENHEVEWRVG